MLPIGTNGFCIRCWILLRSFASALDLNVSVAAGLFLVVWDFELVNWRCVSDNVFVGGISANAFRIQVVSHVARYRCQRR